MYTKHNTYIPIIRALILKPLSNFVEFIIAAATIIDQFQQFIYKAIIKI